jgi:opacity protein-like surface antigen
MWSLADTSCKSCRDPLSTAPIPCEGDDPGKRVDDGRTYLELIPPGSERGGIIGASPGGSAFVKGPVGSEPAVPLAERPLCGEAGPADGNDLPFRITVDGQPVGTDSLMPEADRQRCVDLALSRADIQLRYDPLQIKPALNVWTASDGAVRGEAIEFGAYSNYISWLNRAEIRIFPAATPAGRPLAIIPARWDDLVAWTAPPGAPDELLYLLRVYDGKGRFDETAAKPMRLLQRPRFHGDRERPERERLTGWGQDSRALATIPVSGGTVTVNGTALRPGQTVRTLGLQVPVDPKGSFAMRQILPAGPQTVTVEVSDPNGGTSSFSRNITIPDRDWFYVAIADLTVGQNHVSGPARLVSADTGDTTTHYDNKVYLDGRGAFYLKGKIKGEYLLTASADTREQPIEDLFSNFGSKDPRYLLRRIDPDRYYPVYGDDSTLVEDAPTEGKFYVRLEKGDSHVLWGNFQTSWSGSELTQFTRSLYGGQLVLNSSSITSHGERTTNVNAFAAEPGTLQSREEFRGTGGSLYYLRHIDLTTGSERLWIEVRDRDSDMILERKQLVPVQDYDINYIQGRVNLRTPLPSTTGGTTLVSTGTLPGNPLYLVATYEYVPGLSAIEGIVLGGTASQWLGDHLRLGITGYRQGENSQQQTLLGGDVILRHTPGTFIKGEIARSDGAGAGQANSITGGFDFSSNGPVGQVAVAKRIEAQLDLADAGGRGNGSFYWQEREEGFSGPGQLAPGEAVRQLGGRLTLPVGESFEADLKGDDRNSPSQGARSVEGNMFWKFAREWQLGLGVRDDERTNAVANASSILSENGHRTDLQLRLHFRPLAGKEGEPPMPANWDAFTFVQGTVARDGNRRSNDRAGIGGGWQVTDRFRLTGEASDGTGGVGAQLGGEYRISDRSNVYLNFTSETERPDLNSRGRYTTAVAGTRYRVSDQMALYGETKSTHGAGPESLVHAFGLDLSPNDRWTYGVKGEWGIVSDPSSGDLQRRAMGGTVSYKQGRTSYGGGLEYRNDSGSGIDRQVWLIRSALSFQADPSWRLFCKANLSISSNSQGAFYDGDFVELVSGAAYRPVDNDRWNLLFKYTYFQDVPSPGQVTSDNSVADYSQRSHVLSADVIYDLWKWLSIGGKFGWRGSQLRASKTEGDWFASNAFLGVARADLHLVRKWDVVGEARTLAVTEAKDQRSGFLLAAYYHLSKNVKAGAGYNFTDFSDELTDLSYHSHGWFFNVVATL